MEIVQFRDRGIRGDYYESEFGLMDGTKIISKYPVCEPRGFFSEQYLRDSVDKLTLLSNGVSEQEFNDFVGTIKN